MSSPPPLSSLDVKLVLLGNSGTGKTCIMLRYIEGTFSNTKSTIGASFLTKNVMINDTKMRLQVWDTAGQERFRSMAPMYYRGSHGAIITFDCTNRESFEACKLWVDELQSNVGPLGIVLAIACNKIDLQQQRKVSMEEAQEYSADIGALYFETSAKENIGVEEVFLGVSQKILTVESQQFGAEGGTVNVDDSDSSPRDHPQCCFS